MSGEYRRNQCDHCQKSAFQRPHRCPGVGRNEGHEASKCSLHQQGTAQIDLRDETPHNSWVGRLRKWLCQHIRQREERLDDYAGNPQQSRPARSGRPRQSGTGKDTITRRDQKGPQKEQPDRENGR